LPDTRAGELIFMEPNIDMREHATPGDRVRRRAVYLLERRCEACREWFYVAPQRPAGRYCKSNACKMRRRAMRRKSEGGQA